MALHPRPLPATHAPAGFWCRWETIELHTTTAPEFVDITDRVERAVARSGIVDGMVLVFSRHTTAAIVINESEPLLMDDMATFLDRLAPRSATYRHNDFTVRTVNMTPDESPNGHAHCLHLVLGSSQTIPVHEGRLVLGEWQRVFLVELDKARPREAIVQTIGLAHPAMGAAPVEISRNGARSTPRG
jgi:secondary thiamine-phosphate synthase enzyme